MPVSSLEGWLRAETTDQLIERLDLYEWCAQGCQDTYRDDADRIAPCLEHYRLLTTGIRQIISDREQLRRTLGVASKQRRESLKSRFEAAKATISITDFLFEQGCAVPPGEGRRFKIVCPLGIHEDSTPSFTVYENNRGFYCYGCNQGGSVIDLAMLMLKTSSPVEALEGLQQTWKDQRPPGLIVRR